ncbi:unnamed protein product [Rhizopus stolonifer]
MFRLLTRQTFQQAKRLSTSDIVKRKAINVYPRISPRLFHTTFIRLDKSSTPSFKITSLTTDRYHRLSDEMLEHMVEKLEEIAIQPT